MGHREFSCVVVLDAQGRLLLQLRDNIPTIVYPGRLSVFGGHRQNNESFLECAVRELQEELTFPFRPAQFEHLMSYSGVDLDVAGGTAKVELFVVRDIPADAVVITEGSLFVARPEEIAALRGRFAPFAWMYLEIFFAQTNRL